ncbi:hypothetical protein AWB77_03328 [Caballeronia fortuita]|uniref:Uncharacterized protein n=1 Tax=Caballeronia fortuita TaxID=1777138 RepID=A0A158BWH7_9BURK|nr:hypothetical protein [Caballeronia fortuita]SAK74448.1 hypothetical protein AWB77_03328 [Caballeronia fortuita]
MNRPDISLSLDSVICKRCNTVSAASEDTCPSCGADRQGAIFTSRTEPEPPAAVHASVPAQLDILDWDDSHWLQRLVRRRMLTSYPNFVEPESQEQKKPARTGIAVLVSGVVASIAVGGYFYARLDDNAPPPSADPGISVAGSVRDNALAARNADAARHASLTRSKADSTNGQAAAPAARAATVPTRVGAAVASASPAPMKSDTPSIKPATPIVAAAQKPESHVLAAVSPAPTKPETPTISAPQKPESHVLAAVSPAPTKPEAPSVASAQKPETRSLAAVSTAPTNTEAAAPSIKPATPTIASSQKPEARALAAVPTAPTSKTPAAPSIKQAAPTIASAQKPDPRALAATAPASSKPVEQTQSAPTIASIQKPATPPAPEPLPPSVARSIASVQQALASRDLASARRNMRGLYASETRSPEIQQLAAELSRQERARDGAMATARACVANMEAGCALRNARRAVALDPRNGQAQATLRRALAVQNETNTEYFRQASGIPKPVVPTMTFGGHWSPGTRHAGMSGDDDDSRFTLFGMGVPAVSKGRGDAH